MLPMPTPGPPLHNIGCAVGPADLDDAAGELRAAGAGVVARVCDIRDQAQIDGFIAATMAAFGRIDILVNNAGILSGNRPVPEMAEQQFVTMIDINLTGLWRVTRAVVTHLIVIAGGGGRIVNVASPAPACGSTAAGRRPDPSSGRPRANRSRTG